MFMEIPANFQLSHQSHIWKALWVCNGQEGGSEPKLGQE